MAPLALASLAIVAALVGGTFWWMQAPESPDEQALSPKSQKDASYWMIHYEPPAGIALFMRKTDVSGDGESMRRAWVTWVYDHERIIFPRPVKSQLFLYEINCAEKSYRSLQMEAFASDGLRVDKPMKTEKEFVFASPGSVPAKMIELACDLINWDTAGTQKIAESPVSFATWLFESDPTPVTNAPP